MKNIRAGDRTRYHSAPKQAPALAGQTLSLAGKGNRAVLIGLMVPMMMMVSNASMFGIAVPTVRDVFGIQADIAAWLITAYTLPFMIFMPIYGRLGDVLGKGRLLLAGIVIFLAGTVLTLLAPGLNLLFVGRVIQGIGSAGINPLSLAIISELFPVAERGKALGTWNSIGPASAIGGPLVAGFLIDHLGWRAIFGPPLLVGLLAMLAVYRQREAIPDRFYAGFWRTFDWRGMFSLSAVAILLVFYVSSRPITGVPALHDWRLLISGLMILAGFVWWEKRQASPFINLNIFSNKSFSRASVCAGIRMFTLSSSASFLIPLYLADVHGLSAASTGSVLMLHAAALLITMRIGGQVADSWGSRWPVVVGAALQGGVITYIALLPATASLFMVIGGLVIHGLGAGLSLAALHRAALNRISKEHTGGAAGLYSMIRFSGSVLGTVLAGVVLQQGLDQAAAPVAAYQIVFFFIAAVALLGVMIGWGLRE